MVLRAGAISRPISRSPRPMTATGCSKAGPMRCNQAARNLRTQLKGRVLESIPAARGPGIVAADERQLPTALRDQMPRDRNPGLVVVEAGDGVDRRRRKIP